MRLNLEAKTKEQELIKAYLEENASETLAEKINNGVPFQKDGKTLINKKTLDGFMKFASDEARKLASKGANSACVEDKVVYGWAVHYFKEDSIVGTLYNEDGTEYRIQPKATSKAPVAKTQPKPQPKPQMSMFDLMGDDLEGKPAEEKSDDEQDDMPSDEEIQEIMAEIAEEEQKKPSVSPVYLKYLDVQSKYPQAVIVMRLGDFYEVFGKNAEILADELPLTLTGRDVGLENRIPMVGFPYHASDMYLKKILGYGHSVVLIETDGNVHAMPDECDVDLDTGEILSEEEMREFDGDIEEPKGLDDELDVSAFDKTALAVLDGIFGDKITVR